MVHGDADSAAREALRVRLGKGARYDAPNAPADDLLLARRGAAFFARKLNELSDEDLSLSSLREGWLRAHVVAHVSYQARSMALALKGLREGLNDEELGWEGDVGLAATLPARALRHLYSHSDVHLNVEFRDLVDEHWESRVLLRNGNAVPTRDLPFLRAKTIWMAAVELGNVARPADLPPSIISHNANGQS